MFRSRFQHGLEPANVLQHVVLIQLFCSSGISSWRQVTLLTPLTLALQQQASAQKQVELALKQQEAAAVAAVAEGFFSAVALCKRVAADLLFRYEPLS